MNAKWLVLIITIWLFSVYLGSTFDGYTSSAGTSYSVGTATFTQGSPNVTGQTTAWTSALVGGIIKANTDSDWMKIQSVTDSNDLVLNGGYMDAGGSTVPYAINSSGTWAGNGSGGYQTAPLTKASYLMAVSNAIQMTPVLGAISLPMPNKEYWVTLSDVLTLNFSFVTDTYSMFYWLVLLPIAMGGILCLVLLFVGIVRGNISWG